MNGTITYALLNKRITSSLTGIGDVKLVGTSTLRFTNAKDGSTFDVKLPFDIETIEVVDILPIPEDKILNKVYFLKPDNRFYKCIKDDTTIPISYLFKDITFNGMNIYEDYSFLPTSVPQDTVCYIKNDYTDTSSGNIYKSGFYLYDVVTSSWSLISSNTSDYTKEFTTESDVWNIQHNLNTEYWKLQINVIDDNGNVIYGDIDLDLTTNNLLVLNFTKKITGKVYIKK